MVRAWSGTGIKRYVLLQEQLRDIGDASDARLDVGAVLLDFVLQTLEVFVHLQA
jgi:hypothetical protein